MDLKLKLAQDKDIRFIAEICRETECLYKDIIPGAFIKLADKYLQSGLPKDYYMEIIEVKDERIGFIGYIDLSKGIKYLVALYIAKEYQHSGYGTACMNLLLKDMQISKQQQILLLAHKEAHWAINFYKKYGFNILATNREEAIIVAEEMEQLYIKDTVLMSMKLET